MLVERSALRRCLRIQRADPLHGLDNIGVLFQRLHARLGGDVLNCRPHNGASVAVGCGQDAVVVVGHAYFAA